MFRIQLNASLRNPAFEPIQRVIPDAIVNIVPERAVDLRAELGDKRLVIDDVDTKFNAYADAATRTIGLTTNLIECLWYAAYAHLAFEADLQRQLDSNAVRIELDLAGSQSLQLAERLLVDATNAAASHTPIAPNKDYPQPKLPTGLPLTLEEQATEMALVAIAFVLHHELAHLRLGHTGNADVPPSWTLEKEKEADSAAIEMILSSPANDSETAKRVWGIGIATIFMTSVRFRRAAGEHPREQKEKWEKQTHPFPYDRFGKAFEHPRVVDSEAARHAVARIGCAAMIPMLLRNGTGVPDRAYDGFVDLLNACFTACGERFAS